MKNRVAVTGIGTISPLGIGIKGNWEKIKNSQSAIAEAHFPGSDLFLHSRCGSVPDFDPDEFVSNKKLLKLMNRESLLACTAAKMAYEDASSDKYYKPEKTGIYLGTGLTSGELEYLIPLIEDSIDKEGKFSYELLGRKALSNCNPLISFKILPNMALSYISILFGIKGRNMAFNPWSGNTAQAIGEAMRSIQDGEVQCALAGGCDSKNHFIGFLTFSGMGLLSIKGQSSPFSNESDGLVLSEGAAIAVLENYEMAEKRGARIYAELKGYNCATDSSAINYVSTSAGTLENVICNTIRDAGLSTENIDMICTGANSVSAGDKTEALAINNIFKNNYPPVTGFKALTGDMLAASSAFDLCISSYSLSNGGLPSLLAVNDPGATNDRNLINDPGTDPRLPLNRSYRDPHIQKNILLNSFELGNSKTSLIIQKK